MMHLERNTFRFSVFLWTHMSLKGCFWGRDSSERVYPNLVWTWTLRFIFYFQHDSDVWYWHDSTIRFNQTAGRAAVVLISFLLFSSEANRHNKPWLPVTRPWLTDLIFVFNYIPSWLKPLHLSDWLTGCPSACQIVKLAWLLLRLIPAMWWDHHPWQTQQKTDGKRLPLCVCVCLCLRVCVEALDGFIPISTLFSLRMSQ